MTVASWVPDPTGRHGQRYWDGESWTEHVSDRGQVAVDPVAWPPAVAASGQGLASTSLWFQRLAHAQPWSVVDADGALAGWVVGAEGRTSLPRTARLLDAAQRLVAVQQQRSFRGCHVKVDEAVVAELVAPPSSGRADEHYYRIEIDGSLRAQLQYLPGSTDPVPVLDPSGTAIATVRRAPGVGNRIDLHLVRLVTLPYVHDLAVMSLPIVMLMDADLREYSGVSPFYRGGF